MSMGIEGDTLSLLKVFPKPKDCCYCVSVKCGTRLVAILGILLGFTCIAIIIIRDRKQMTFGTAVLIMLLSIFIVITVMIVVVSVLLFLAAEDKNPELMTYYIWLAIMYMCVQLVLAVFIPLVLVLDGKYPIAVAMVWLVIVMIVSLGWTHFISVVNTYRMSLY